MNHEIVSAPVPVVALATMLAAYVPAALAYVGPGAGLGMIASLFAVVVAILATIVGLVLWPIRKLSQRKKETTSTSDVEHSKPTGRESDTGGLSSQDRGPNR